jgi:hypothetical protein
MKLELEALSQAEGIGIIRSGRTLRLVRPPYTLQDAPILSEDSLQDAILCHGFSASGQQFQSWEDAIAFLNQQAVAARRLLGKEIPETIPGPDILDVAPPEVLSAFLDRVERQIIPQRLFDHAEDFLLALLKSKAPTHQPRLGHKAAELLQLNSEARKKADAGISQLASRDVRFPSLERRRGDFEWSVRLAELIRERGCVFAPAS